MATEVVIPILGVTVEKGKIIEWLKKEGDTLAKGESIFVVEADKVTTEVESPAGGILSKILLPAGQQVPVLTVAAVITSPREEVPAAYLETASTPAPPTAEPANASVAWPPASPVSQYATDGDTDFDLAIMGAGPGGYVAAICGARKGLKTMLVEKDALGGTCLNRGCIPTKSMVYDAKLYKAATISPVLTGTDQLGVDMTRLRDRKRKVVQNLVAGVGGLVKSHGVTVFTGEGHLDAPGRVSVQLANGQVDYLRVKDVILANGSKPSLPPMIQIDGRRVQTTDEVLDDDTLPDRLVIIGGGVIGIEMATIFLNLGTQVTILELLPDILFSEDQDVRKEMKRQLKKYKAEVHLGAATQKITVEDSHVQVVFKDFKQQEHILEADKVIVATGRTPVTTGIDIQKLGLETDGPFLKVDRRLQTNLPGVYAIGDLIGGMMLAHKASAEAEAVIENIIHGADRSVATEQVPRCIWGLLEIGAIGLTEEKANQTGRTVKVGKFPLGASGAAQAMGQTDGFVKIIGDRDSGEILGVHIMGEHATDMIAEAISVMAMEGAVEDLCETVKPHPTISEALMEAALDWNNLSIHLPKKLVRQYQGCNL